MIFKNLTARERIIFALDVPGYNQALGWVRRLKGLVGFFKVGQELFTSCGPRVVESVKAEGGRVFLDMKFHDIPNTVKGAVASAAKLGVDMLTLHCLGGFQMMHEASRAGAGKGRPALLGVTVLTSLGEEAVKQLGLALSLEEEVVLLARLARQAGLDGVVASPLELASLREVLGDDLLLICPGIRPSFSPSHDQARQATPGQAVRAGADLLVIGRPVREAADPDAVLELVVDEIEAALRAEETGGGARWVPVK